MNAPGKLTSLYIGAERNGGHDAVTKLFVQDSLVGVSVVLNNLVQTVDERLFGWHGHRSASVRQAVELVHEELLVEAEERR